MDEAQITKCVTCRSLYTNQPMSSEIVTVRKLHKEHNSVSLKSEHCWNYVPSYYVDEPAASNTVGGLLCTSLH